MKVFISLWFFCVLEEALVKSEHEETSCCNYNSSGDGSYDIWKISLVAGGAVIGAPLAVAAVPAVVGALGFSAGGIVSGSVGAWMMSTCGGATAATGVVATLQSVGAAGLGLGGTIVAGGVGASAGAAAVTGLVGYVHTFPEHDLIIFCCMSMTNLKCMHIHGAS